jgi:muramidase (phage lysozyme)
MLNLCFAMTALALAACGRSEGLDAQTLAIAEDGQGAFVTIGEQDTMLKVSTSDSADMKLGTEKCVLAAGGMLLLQEQPEVSGSHYFVKILNPLTDCSLTQGYIFRDHIKKTSLKALFSGNMRAFLDTLAFAEGTNDSYNYIFSFATFSSYAGHPRRLMCSGGYCSDAAGRYQIKSTTWDEVRRTLGLTDFSPESQDRAAVQLIKWRGGYDDVERINSMNSFDDAVYAVRYEWASLPHSPYGQPVHSVAKLWSMYQKFRDRY